MKRKCQGYKSQQDVFQNCFVKREQKARQSKNRSLYMYGVLWIHLCVVYCMSNFQFVQKYHGLSVRSLFPGHDNGQEAFISTKQLNQGIIDLHCYMAFNGGNLCTKLFMLPLDFIISVIKVMSHGCTFTPKSKGHQNPKIAIYRTTSFSATSYY